MYVEEKVMAIEPHDKGRIALLLACGHRVSLDPTPGETTEQKMERFQDYVGELNPCKVCTERQRPKRRPAWNEKAYQHYYYETVTKPKRRGADES